MILSILLIANLINIAISLAMGWKDNISVLLRYSLILAAIKIPMFLAVTGWDSPPPDGDGSKSSGGTIGTRSSRC